MAAQFKTKLKTALDKFDLVAAETLLDEISVAETLGYTLTKEEEKLWDRLTTCIETYYRIDSALDT